MSAVTKKEALAGGQDVFAELFPGAAATTANVVQVAPPAAAPAVRPPSFAEMGRAKAREAEKAKKKTGSPIVEVGLPPEMVAEWIEAKHAEKAARSRLALAAAPIAEKAAPALVARCQEAGGLVGSINLDGGPVNFSQPKGYTDVRMEHIDKVRAAVGDIELSKKYFRESLSISIPDEMVARLGGADAAQEWIGRAIGVEAFSRLEIKISHPVTEDFHRDYMLDRGGLRARVRGLIGRELKPYSPRLSMKG